MGKKQEGGRRQVSKNAPKNENVILLCVSTQLRAGLNFPKKMTFNFLFDQVGKNMEVCKKADVKKSMPIFQ